MKRLLVIQTLCCALLALTLACSPRPADVVKSFTEAYNDGDLDKVLSLYSEEGTFEIPGLFSFQGREELRRLAEYDMALNLYMDISEVVARGDTVICQLKETSDWIETSDIGEAYFTAIFVVRQGRILSVVAKLTLESDRAFRRVMMPLMDWARTERPEQLAELMPQGEFVYDAKNAKRYLSLLMEFKQNVHRQGIRPGWRKLGE
jgi:limonene-1,2-epoxide hydrolase